MSNKLNQLLENAKHENPLLTENDVISVINNRSLLGKKQTFFTLKNILIMSVLSSIIIGLWMVFYPTATTNLTEQTSRTSLKNKEQLTEKSEANNLLADVENNKKFTTTKETRKSLQVFDSLKNFPAIHNKPATKLFDPIPFTPLFNENPIDDNRTYFDKDGYLILANEELAKLGIITDGNVLKYENVTDTFFTFKENGKITTQHTSFKLNVEEHGSRSTSLGISKDTVIIKKSLPFWAASLSIINFPIAINTTNKKDSSHQIIEFLNGNSYENDFLKEIESMLVPIVVHLKSVPHKYSSDLKLIFWFKTEPKFYEVLSNDIANAVEHKYGTSTESDYKRILYKYRGFSRKTAQKGFDSLIVKRLQKNYIQLNDKQLKELNITKKRNGFKLKSYQNIDNRTNILRLKVKNGNSECYDNVNILNLIKRKNPQYLVVAKTDISIKHIHYLMQFSDSVPHSKQNEMASKYFRENVQKLIPIKVDSSYLIWFEPTEDLKRIIEKQNKQITRTHIYNNLKLDLLNLNEFELKKLGISFEKKAIKMPIISYKNSTVFISLRKRNSSTLFHFDTSENQNKPLYPIPLLVTDQSGLYWRFYNLDTTYEVGKFNEYTSKMTQQLNNCIPIKIVQNNVSIIAWYEPDSLFLSSLPNTESTEIKTEYHAISNNLPAPSCKYFEVCQNVTGKINSYLAYPNPAEQTLNIEIDLAEERQLEFIITDITGKIIKTLNQNLNQAKGTQTYTYQIGELTEGMYLLVITTDKGEKVSTRIVKR
ncbi:MAG: T9SS type A sorting domain-containing protein [Bacteroidia bacterium]